MDAKMAAATILSQLGGNKFIAMTGAKNFGYFSNENGECGLSFKLPSRFANKGINLIKIKLTFMDVYEMTFYRLNGTSLKTIDSCNDVYCDQLQDIFTSITGLNTYL